MIQKLTILVLLIITLAFSCEKPPGAKSVYRIWIKNNSSIGISYLISKSYPDTLIPDAENSLLMLTPSEDKTYDQKEKWEMFFAQLPAGKLSVFFFNNDTLANYGFQQVRATYNILSRKDITLQDLQNNNFTVTYP